MEGESPVKEPALYHQRDFQASLLTRGTREQIIDWLMWNDPNGTYSDRDSAAEEMRALSLHEARRIMSEQTAES